MSAGPHGTARATDPVDVVGMVGGEVFGRAARHAVADAQVLAGAQRHLAHVEPSPGQVRVTVAGPLGPLLDRLGEHRDEGSRVCVLSSGDPGFFGITRLLSARFGADAVQVHPAPSSVSLAWAAAGLSWDDAAVVSAHGRDLAAAVEVAVRLPKAAVLTSPTAPPHSLGVALRQAGCGPRSVVVTSRLGEPDESLVRTDLSGLAAGEFDPMSVVLLVSDDGAPARTGPSLSWGAPESRFTHRDSMITKSEVRAVALAALDLPRAGVLWDVGAGSGSVAVEAATLAPAMRVLAVEKDPDALTRVERNAAAFGVADVVQPVPGVAPQILAELPDPDRVFVGGGGIDVVRAAWDRLRPGGVLVATFVLLDRAVAAFRLLGSLTQVQVSRGEDVADLGVRLRGLNPVFVCSGRRT